MAAYLDQFAGLLAPLGPAGTALALAAVPVVAGAAVYVTRMGSQARIDRLEGELARLEKAKTDDLADAARKLAELRDKYEAILRSGALIQSQLDAIVAEAAEVAARLDASDYAVLVPAPTFIPGDVPSRLVFLCASGPQAASLKWVRVPISGSLSGQVYLSGQATIASPPPSGAAFASRTDQITDYKTQEALSVCLRYRNRRVGVAQFLNKRTGRFNSDDLDRAMLHCATLAIRVGDFVEDPRRLIEMGHAPRQKQFRATIMFVDLSHYGSLFDKLENSIIADMINQYFQELCAVALRHEGVVDQFIGDGILIVFNIDQNQDNHEIAALNAAIEMRSAFSRLRERWVTLGYAGSEALFVRFGLSCGLVTRVEVGPAQVRRLTVIGAAVNAAAEACDRGPRDRDTICLTQEAKEALPAGFRAERLPCDAATIFELVT